MLKIAMVRINRDSKAICIPVKPHHKGKSMGSDRRLCIEATCVNLMVRFYRDASRRIPVEPHLICVQGVCDPCRISPLSEGSREVPGVAASETTMGTGKATLRYAQRPPSPVPRGIWFLNVTDHGHSQ